MELEPENADACHKLAEILHLGPRWGFPKFGAILLTNLKIYITYMIYDI